MTDDWPTLDLVWQATELPATIVAWGSIFVGRNVMADRKLRSAESDAGMVVWRGPEALRAHLVPIGSLHEDPVNIGKN